MKLCRSVILGLSLLIAPASIAQAGDFGTPIGAGSPPPLVSAGNPVSWYVRGDIGYVYYDDPEMIEDRIFDLGRESIDDSWSISGGIGYYFTDHVRADITVTHFAESGAKGYNASVGAAFAPGMRNFDLESTATFFNVYYDFSSRQTFTPYVGVGLGFAVNKTGTGSVTDNCGCTGTIAGDTTTSVAAQLMFGLAYNWGGGFHLDAGYHFVYLGEAHTGDITGTVNGNAANGGDPAITDLVLHQFRVGGRYDLW